MIIKGILREASATAIDNGYAKHKSKIIRNAPNKKHIVNAVSTYCLLASFFCITAEPIPVSEKLAKIVVIAVKAE